MADFKPPEPPEDYYRHYGFEQFRKAVLRSAGRILLFGLAWFLLMWIMNGGGPLDGKMFASIILPMSQFLLIFMAIPLLIFSFHWIKISSENAKKRIAWEIKIIEMKKKHGDLTRKYIEQYNIYYPLIEKYANEAVEYNRISELNASFNRDVEGFSVRFQALVADFEALWRVVEFKAKMELEITSRADILAMFAVAFSDSLAKEPRSGWLQLYAPMAKVQMDLFPRFEAGNYPLMARFLSVLEGAASRRPKGVQSDYYLQNDDRMAAVAPLLPQLTYDSGVPWDTFLLSGPLPPKPERPPAPRNLLVHENGFPYPVEQVKFKL